jgi:hypothetical protein
MLIIPSRGRPQNLSRLIAACINTGVSTPAWVRLDEDDESLPQYAALSMPRHWEIVIGPRVPLSEVYNEAYREIPETSHWVFVADDVVPVTQGWDRLLIDIAGTDGMSVPEGGETTGGCPHFALGGELVRSVGWLALPGLDRIYIDTCWHDIAKRRGVLRPAPGVILEHRHFSNGKALLDSTYRKHNKDNDKAIYEKFIRSIHAYSS